MSDIIPEHYKNCSLECWDAMKLMLGTDGFISFCLGNAFKYLWRHEYKNGKEDILTGGKVQGGEMLKKYDLRIVSVPRA